MKKIILGAIALVGLFGISSAYAVNIYSTQEDFEKAEGQTCKMATDGCNSFFVQNGKIGGGTLMYCDDIYGKKGKEKWSCLTKRITSKEAFIKKYGQTCETASDGVNTFFGKDFMASTMIGYPENFVADWTCKKEKEMTMCTMEYAPVCGVDGKIYSNKCMAGKTKIAYQGECKKSNLSENDENLLKHLGKTMDKKLKSKIDSALVKYQKRLAKIKNQRAVNNKIIEKVEDVIFSKIMMKYPQDSILPKKASNLYNVLKYLQLSLMNINFDEKNTVKIANPASEFCVKQGGTLEIKDEKNGQVGYCKLKDGKVVEEWKYFRENNK